MESWEFYEVKSLLKNNFFYEIATQARNDTIF